MQWKSCVAKQDIVRFGVSPGISHPVRGNIIECAETTVDMFMDGEDRVTKESNLVSSSQEPLVLPISQSRSHHGIHLLQSSMKCLPTKVSA